MDPVQHKSPTIFVKRIDRILALRWWVNHDALAPRAQAFPGDSNDSRAMGQVDKQQNYRENKG